MLRPPEPTAPGPLLLGGETLRNLLDLRDLLATIDTSLRQLDGGELAVAASVYLPGDGGGFHVKSAFSAAAPRRAVVKINGNFPGNPGRFGLPTIQGVAALLDGERGSILALFDSTALTALRTAAVSAVAAQRLARPEARRLALVGCGVQARDHFELLRGCFPLETVTLFDRDPGAARRLADRIRPLGLGVEVASSVRTAAQGADLIVTSTPSREALLDEGDVGAGAFVAAVGADNPEKCELAPALLAGARVVVDSLALAAANGDLRTALAAGTMTADDVHGELPALVAGRIAGRTSPDQRFVFDSTGLAATDLAVASLAYDRAASAPGSVRFDFAATAGDAGGPARESRRSP